MEELEYMAGLFTEDIYLVREEIASDNGAVDDTTAFMGMNKKGIVILVHDSGADCLPPDHEELLRKILASVQLTMDDVYVINTFHYKEAPLSFGSRVVSFGDENLSLHSEITEKYKIINVEGIEILPIDSLVQIGQSVELKKKLWSCLKEMFLQD